MGFKEWLYYELCNDGVIDPDITDIDPDTYDADDLCNSTDFEMNDMDTYVGQYEDYCNMHGQKPVMDLEMP